MSNKLKVGDQVAQGDLLIELVKPNIRRKMTPREPVNGRLIVAEGEATGHHHVLVGPDVTLEEDLDGELFFEVPEGKVATLEHDEHDALEFTPGRYRVITQREQDPPTPAFPAPVTTRRVWD